MKYTDKEKRALYESIMRDVAVSVKKHLNELSFPIMKRAQRKRVDYFKQSDDLLYSEQYREFTFVPNDKITVFDSFEVSINLEEAQNDIYFVIEGNNDDYTLEITADIDPKEESILKNVEWKIESNYSYSGEVNVINKIDFVTVCNLFSRQDALKLAKTIREETGIKLSWRNFTDESFYLPKDIVDLSQEDKTFKYAEDGEYVVIYPAKYYIRH